MVHVPRDTSVWMQTGQGRWAGRTNAGRQNGWRRDEEERRETRRRDRTRPDGCEAVNEAGTTNEPTKKKTEKRAQIRGF